VFGRTAGLTYHESNTEDPYIVVNDEQDDDDELEEMEIQPTDNLIIACKTMDEMSHLEIYVYEESENNLYVHHDILLPSFPLCAEWIDYTPASGKKGNYVAVGTFDPQIEIWDLDTIDAIYPTAILGCKTGSARKKPSKKKAAAGGGHTGPVTALASNKTSRNLLLSGSIDTTVKLWDLNAQDLTQATRTFTHHTDKVCCTAWNPATPSVFLSGGFDGVYALDSRFVSIIVNIKCSFCVLELEGSRQ
jgi:periodic tryptophan protein 1